MRIPWTTALGADGTFEHNIRDGQGNLIGTSFAGTEALSASVWPGGALAPLPGVLQSAWTAPFDGTVATTVRGAATAALVPGYYKVQVTVTTATATLPIYEGWLRLTPVPGTATPGPVYATFDDVVAYGGDWVQELISESGESGFQYELERARMWLDTAIVGKFRVLSYRYGPQYWVQLGTWPWGPPDAPDRTITEYLQQNLLIVPPRDQAVEICAHRALSQLCAKKVDFSDQTEKFRLRARYHNDKANQLFAGLRAQIDLNADGWPELAMNCGVISLR
jgi:hypothetical protein